MFWLTSALTAAVAALVIVFASGFGASSTPEVLPTVPKALAAQAGTHISAHHAVSGAIMSQAAIEQDALERFQDAKVRDSALVYLDDDVVRPAIHDNVWAVSLALPQGSGILPDPETGQWTKVTYFLAVFDPHTGAFLFAESQ